MNFTRILSRLTGSVDALTFAPPVAYVYNPVDYAREPYLAYLNRFGTGRKKAVLLGMNPGPWGMAQTCIPFGEVEFVSQWMGIAGKVGHPPREHPARRISGFSCKRHEVSGMRLWSWARERFGTPENFFSRFLVVNYCPLMFLEESGKNRTPDRLPAGERIVLEDVCDKALLSIVRLVDPEYIIGVGGYAESAARRALKDTSVKYGRITHPSPANPSANRGWKEIVEKELTLLGLLQ